MRAALKLCGAAVVGAFLIVGCSDSETEVDYAAGAAGMPAAHDAGSGGIEEPGGAAGVAGTPGASGQAPVDSAGAGGACAGDYECPLVGYSSYAKITATLPVSAAAAADAVFTACRNTECRTKKGSATVNPNNAELGWAEDDDGSPIRLTFDASGSAPSVVLGWYFLPDAPIPSDHYSLTIQPVGEAAPTTLFDLQVNYTIQVADPTLVSEGYCHHCSEVSRVELDLRATQ